MTTERLEELAQWAHDQSVEQDIDGSSVRADYLRDLSRCARAWAKFQRMIEGQDGYSLDFWYWKEKTRLLTNSYSGRGATAIEAVEAAEVGK